MSKNNLLASVALFSELYNNRKYSNIYDVIAEFIKGAIYSERKWDLPAVEIVDLLNKNYNFNIPDSVVRSTLKNKLKSFYVHKNGIYHFEKEKIESFAGFNDELVLIRQKQQNVLDRLITYIEEQKGPLTEKETHLVVTSFQKYLLDNAYTENYAAYISAFVISNKNDEEFTHCLNLIKEGVVLHQGIRYTAKLNELGTWNSKITIFLSTEYLFNAMGYNGTLFEQGFRQFFSMVNDVNMASRNKQGDRKIELKYLEETKEEIDVFFHMAEQILSNKQRLDHSRPAMKHILEGCKTLSDIKEKRIQFERDLGQMLIHLEHFNTSLYNNHNYVVEDKGVLAILQKDAQEKGREFDEAACLECFRIFTKINNFRKGQNQGDPDNMGYLFLTSNSLFLYLSHHDKVKFKEGDIPFAKDIDYMTNRLWFKMKKGLDHSQEPPISFNVVAKAQIVLSSMLNQKVSHRYDGLLKKFEEGNLTREEALQRSYEMRERSMMPEEINEENVNSSLEFLHNDSYFENLYEENIRRKIEFDTALQENESLKKEIHEFRERDRKIRESIEEGVKWMEETNYLEGKWKQFKKGKYRDVTIFAAVVLISGLAIALPYFFKNIPAFERWINSLGGWTYLFQSVLILLPWSELIGRSYLFPKEKIKGGWEWVVISCTPARKKDLRIKFEQEARKEYRR